MDIIGLGALVLAAFVIIKLRSILGETHWDEPQDKKSVDRSKRYTNEEADLSNNKPPANVIDLPTAAQKTHNLTQEQRQSKIQAFLGRHCLDDEKLKKIVLNIHKSDESFDIEQFYKSANQAYEMIVTAFGSGDKKTLSSLLSKKIYGTFEKEIDKRVKRGEIHSFDFVGIEDSKIVGASLVKDNAKIKVRFVSSFFQVVYDQSKKIIDGSETQSTQAIDLWSFSRDLKSSDPTWYLAATQSE